MKISAALFVLVVVTVSEVTADDDIPTWEEFKAIYHKQYGTRTHEEERRHRIFNHNVAKIRAHNKLYEVGKTSYKQGVNAFSDKTIKEVIETSTGLKLPPEGASQMNAPTSYTYQTKGKFPNWTKNKCMSPVRNQGQCGSCWAFAANTALNTRYCMVHDLSSAEEYSDQHLVDCDTAATNPNCNNGGCKGGWPACAYDYIEGNDITMNIDYPYTAKDGVCKAGVDPSKVITGNTVVSDEGHYYGCMDESGILQALRDGPVVVGIHVTSKFQSYQSGVFKEKRKYSTDNRPQWNHAVVITGATKRFWRVQNSWGKNWGEDGYIRIKRGKEKGFGTLGINYWVMWPIPA